MITPLHRDDAFPKAANGRLLDLGNAARGDAKDFGDLVNVELLGEFHLFGGEFDRVAVERGGDGNAVAELAFGHGAAEMAGRGAVGAAAAHGAGEFLFEVEVARLEVRGGGVGDVGGEDFAPTLAQDQCLGMEAYRIPETDRHCL